MKPLFFVWIATCIILASLVSAGNVSIIAYSPVMVGSPVICYQETANVSTACGGLNTGRYSYNTTGWDVGYNYNKSYDGNYSTYAYTSTYTEGGPTPGPLLIRVNYTIPTYGVRTNTSWIIKDWRNDNDINTTLTIPQSYWNTPLGKIVLEMRTYNSRSYHLACNYDYSDCTVLTGSPLGVGKLYEESMYWNITQFTNATLNLSTSFSDFVVERANNTIFLQVNSSLLTTSFANLCYNGTYYPTIATFNPTYTLFQASVFNNTIIGGINPTNISYIFFNYTLYDYNGTSYNGSTILTNISQLVYRPRLINCSLGNGTTILRLDAFDEDTPTERRIVDWQVNNYITNGTDTVSNFSGSYAQRNNISICLVPWINISTYTFNSFITYNSSTGYTNRYYVFDLPLENKSNNYTVYALNRQTLSDVRFTLRNADNFNFYSGIVGALQRYYIGEGTWRIVQEDMSDIQGLTVYHVIEETQDYRMQFFDQDNHVLMQTDIIKFACTSGLCLWTFTVQPFQGQSLEEATHTITFDNTTKNVTVTFSQPQGTTIVFRLEAAQFSFQKVTYCDQTLTASNGTIVCSLDAAMGEVTLNLYQDGSIIHTENIRVRSSNLGDNIDRKDAVIVAMLLIISLMMVGVVMGVVAMIIITVFALYLLSLMSILTFLTTTLVVCMGIVGIMISVKVRK